MKNKIIVIFVMMLMITAAFAVLPKSQLTKNAKAESITYHSKNNDNGGYKYDFESEGWYKITFPEDIWLYNTSIRNDDSCENFCQQGGIWTYIDVILYYDEDDEEYPWKSWVKNEPSNQLSHLTYGEEYQFHVLDACTLHFEYDSTAQIFTPPFFDDGEVTKNKKKAKDIAHFNDKLKLRTIIFNVILDLIRSNEKSFSGLIKSIIDFRRDALLKHPTEEPLPTHPYADANSNKNTGKLYVKADTYLSLPGQQAAFAEAKIIGCEPTDKYFTVPKNGNYEIKFNFKLNSGIAWIKCGIGGHIAAGSASLGGFLYEKGDSGQNYIKTCTNVIYARTDYGDNEYHHNFINDPKQYSCKLTSHLSANKEYYFTGCLHMESGCKVLLLDIECKAQGELDMNLNSVTVEYSG